MSTISIHSYLRQLRVKEKLTLREVSAYLKIDQGLFSKMENGKRPFNNEVISKLAKLYKQDVAVLNRLQTVERLYQELREEEHPLETLKVLEKRVKYELKSAPESSFIRTKLAGYFKSCPEVEEVSLFGSFVRNEQTAKSDVDLLIRFGRRKAISMFDFLNMQHELSNLLGRKVDLVEYGQIKAHARPSVVNESEVIYVREKRLKSN
jgi:predicted nucleotidyltransferase/plasmid maintenance system antidote protein VapI